MNRAANVLLNNNFVFIHSLMSVQQSTSHDSQIKQLYKQLILLFHRFFSNLLIFALLPLSHFSLIPFDYLFSWYVCPCDCDKSMNSAQKMALKRLEKLMNICFCEFFSYSCHFLTETFYSSAHIRLENDAMCEEAFHKLANMYMWHLPRQNQNRKFNFERKKQIPLLLFRWWNLRACLQTLFNRRCYQYSHLHVCTAEKIAFDLFHSFRSCMWLEKWIKFRRI